MSVLNTRTLKWLDLTINPKMGKLPSLSLALWQQVVIHASIWIAYKSFLYFFNVVRGDLTSTTYWLLTGFATLLEILIFYIFYLYFVPYWLERNKIGLFLIVSVALAVLLPFPSYWYLEYIMQMDLALPQSLRLPNNYSSYHWTLTFNFIILMGLASGVRFGTDWFQNQRIKRYLEQENQQSELALLRSQINPHFLFNTLNNIYSLSYQQAPKASQAILKLSELMRYMLMEATHEEVALTQEIEYIKNYISLQKIRLNNPEKVIFEIKGDPNDLKISPMLLIPFIENAFKHGIRGGHSGNLEFRLSVSKEEIHFFSQNEIASPQRANTSIEERGIGYQNVKRRLELIYPKQHALKIWQASQQYFVDLTINLNKTP